MKQLEKPGHENIQVWSKAGTLQRRRHCKEKSSKIWLLIKFVKRDKSKITYVEGNRHLWNYNNSAKNKGNTLLFCLTNIKLNFSQADKNNVNRWQTPGSIIGKPILTLDLLLTTMIKWQNILLNVFF